MEQDIEKVENLIKKCDECKLKECINCEISWNEVQAIKRFYKAYKELEEKNKKKSIEIICYQEELENRIPVSLLEEKIEELKNKSKYCSSDELREYSQQIQVLEELLREEK